MSDQTLHHMPCQRCGCYMTYNFKCDCGQVHGDVCDNCGLRRPLSGETTPDKYLSLSSVDVRCEMGPVAHAHRVEEKNKRISDFFARARESNHGERN